MQAVLFSSDAGHCFPLVAGLRSENIFVNVATHTDEQYKHQLLSGTHFFFFQHQLSASDLTFLRLVRTMKPTAVTILLDPPDASPCADVDFVFSRPYSYPLISLHIQRKLLEKREQHCPREVRLGNLVLHLQRRALVKDSLIVPLKNKEFSLLQYFFMNDGRVVSRSDILEYVWDHNAPLSTNTVDVHISRLRAKLKLCDADQYLQTVHCIGYLWSCDSI